MLEEPLMLHETAIEATYKEREPGYAERILGSYPITAGDVLVIVSNSGRNAVPIELALGARKRGVKTVAITNRAQSFAWPARHPSGKRLAEVADVVIDNCIEPIASRPSSNSTPTWKPSRWKRVRTGTCLFGMLW